MNGIEVRSGAEFSSLDNVALAREKLERQGCLLFNRAYTRDECAELVRWIDAHAGEGDERNYGGTEHRIWGAQDRAPALREFWTRSNAYMSRLLDADKEAYTLLAIRNRRLDAHDAASLAGRWHIDSFRQQYKAFLFLSDVAEANGPFEFIQGTHAAAFKIKMALKGNYFAPLDLLRGSRSYSKLTEESVGQLAADGLRPIPVLCEAGTVMVVNTSAVHRARPCKDGGRYALTAYYR